MAVLAGIFGWGIGPFLVSPLAALSVLFLMYSLARRMGLSPIMSFAGACIIAAFPVFLFIAVQPMSDVLAAAWVILVVFAALRSRKRESWALLAGAGFGMSVLVRPSNILVLFALAAALPFKLKAYLKFFLGGCLFGAVQLGFNQNLYGNPFVSGYRTEVVNALALPNLPRLIPFIGRWLSRMLTPLVLFSWFAVMADRKVPLRDRLVLFLWFAPFLIFYGLYQPLENWTFIRFFLPALPAVILSALFVLRDGTSYALQKTHSADRIGTGKKRTRAQLIKIAAVALVILVVFVEIGEVKKLRLLDVDEYESVYKKSCLAVKEALPENSVVIAGQLSGALTYYTHVLPCLWDSLQPSSFSVLQFKASQRGFGIYALLFPHEESEFQKYAPGAWEKITNYEFVSLWKFKEQ
jgi:hypothetical protein